MQCFGACPEDDVKSLGLPFPGWRVQLDTDLALVKGVPLSFGRASLVMMLAVHLKHFHKCQNSNGGSCLSGGLASLAGTLVSETPAGDHQLKLNHDDDMMCVCVCVYD